MKRRWMVRLRHWTLESDSYQVTSTSSSGPSHLLVDNFLLTIQYCPVPRCSADESGRRTSRGSRLVRISPHLIRHYLRRKMGVFSLSNSPQCLWMVWRYSTISTSSFVAAQERTGRPRVLSYWLTLTSPTSISAFTASVGPHRLREVKPSLSGTLVASPSCLIRYPRVLALHCLTPTIWRSGGSCRVARLTSSIALDILQLGVDLLLLPKIMHSFRPCLSHGRSFFWH